jgi:hypothetical protein
MSVKKVAFLLIISSVLLRHTVWERGMPGRSGGKHLNQTTRVRIPSAAPPLELGVGRLGFQIRVEVNLVPKHPGDAGGF